MKKRITGAITFLVGLVVLLFVVYALLDDNYITAEEIFVMSGTVILSVSGMLYVYWTKFGGDPEISEVERENKLLRSKIERKKLKKELEED